MTSRTGNRAINAGSPMRRRAFTLIELILVMALLTVVLAVAAPSLARFFRGRGLDSEARRFLALTRYGQSRAVSEGIPMVMWIDQEGRTYGLMAESSYDEVDGKAVQYQLAKDVDIEVELPTLRTSGNRTTTTTMPWQRTIQLVGKLPTIRFTPDGSIDETSPEYVMLKEGDDDNDQIWIGPSRSRLNYEIQTNQPYLLRR